MMNLAMKAGAEQMKEQTQNLLPSEMQDKNEEQKEENGPKEPNIEINNKGNPIVPKKKQKPVIDKSLAVRMYSFLLFHTLLLTALLYIIHYKFLQKINDEGKKLGKYEWGIFVGCIVLSILLSLLVSKVKCISTIYLNYILYIVLLALNAFAFVWGGKDNLFPYIASMLIMFDAGSLTVLIFSLCVKDAPSTFWVMCSCIAGQLVAMFILIKVYSDQKYLILLVCAISFAVYEVMNYSAFDIDKVKGKTTSVPSVISLPFELNVSYVKLLYYIIYGIVDWCISCCCPPDKKKK